MLNLKDAKKLKRPMTIDLKYINAKEYCNKIENKNLTIERMKKYITIAGISWFILVTLFGWGIITSPEAKANNTGENLRFLSRFPDEKTVIGCYNDRTKQTRQESRCTKGGDHNIMLPPRFQIKVWLKYFNEFEIINRLALVNFESGFDENANNPYAIGYVQTLRSHGVSKDINSQLNWLANRQNSQKVVYTRGGSKRCGYYWNNNNNKDGYSAGEYGVLSCLYRYHYHAYKGTWYAKRGITTTKYYKYYMFGIK